MLVVESDPAGAQAALVSHGFTCQLYADLWRTVLEGRVWQGELCNRKKDGDWERSEIGPLRGADGQITLANPAAARLLGYADAAQLIGPGRARPLEGPP